MRINDLTPNCLFHSSRKLDIYWLLLFVLFFSFFLFLFFVLSFPHAPLGCTANLDDNVPEERIGRADHLQQRRL